MQQFKQRTTQQFKQAMSLGLSAVSRVLTGTCACVVSRKLPGNIAGASVGAKAAGQTHVRVLLLRLLSDYSDLASWLAWWADVLGCLHRAEQMRQAHRNIHGTFPEVSGRAWRGQLSDQDPGRRRRTGRVQGRGEAHLGLSGRCAPSPGGFRLHLPHPACSLNCRRLPQRGRGCRLPRAGRGRDWAALQLESGALWSAPAAWPASRDPSSLPSCTQLPIPAQPVSYSAAARYGSGPEREPAQETGCREDRERQRNPAGQVTTRCPQHTCWGPCS